MITSDALSFDERHSVEALLEATCRHDGVSALDEAARLALSGSGARHLLIPAGSSDPVGTREGEEHDLAGAAVGYASILPDGTVQGMVHPSLRRQGHGTALLRATLAERPDAGVWAHGALDPSLAFLSARGLQVTRRLLTLHLELTADTSLPPVPAARIDDMELGSFVAERDADAWVRVNAQAFADHPEQGALTREDLDRRTAETWFDPEDLLLARKDEDLLGFVWIKREPVRADEPAVAELYVVGTAPQAQGKGVAGHLIGAALHRLRQTGAERVELYVEADNTAALELYRRWGFELAAEDVQLRLPEAA